MSIGARIKAARALAGLSQRELATQAGVSAMAISKYERDLDVPGSAVLLRLAKSLSVRIEYFFRSLSVVLTISIDHKRRSLPPGVQARLVQQVQEWLERYLEVESLFEGLSHVDLPPKRPVATLDDIETIALELRERWQLGNDAIEELCESLEAHGVKVGLVEVDQEFDALTLWANGAIPIIVVKRDLPGDRQRFALAQELAYLVLDPAVGLDPEAAAFRFAGAFLVPAPAVETELGARRHAISLYELHLLKHKYGLSMQAWLYRAKDLKILDERDASRLLNQFRKGSWDSIEPGDALPPEHPQRQKRLVMRALAEDFISPARAAELLGKSLSQFRQEEAKQHGGLLIAVGA